MLPRARSREAGVGDGPRQRNGATRLRRHRRRILDVAQLRTRRPKKTRSPLCSSSGRAAAQAVDHANMSAMWRVGRTPTVLLAIFLTPAIACPAAWASPEG